MYVLVSLPASLLRDSGAKSCSAFAYAAGICWFKSCSAAEVAQVAREVRSSHGGALPDTATEPQPQAGDRDGASLVISAFLI